MKDWGIGDWKKIIGGGRRRPEVFYGTGQEKDECLNQLDAGGIAGAMEGPGESAAAER